MDRALSRQIASSPDAPRGDAAPVTRAGSRPAARRWVAEYGLLCLFALVTVAALVGYSTFRLQPDLLSRMPEAIPVYAAAFTVFARAQIALAFIALAVFLWKHASVRWLPAFVALYVISLASELLGTTVGLPFGPYHYTPALGTQWFGHVPMLIPLSWFFMALPSYALAGNARDADLTGGERTLSTIRRIAIASLLLLTWDLSLDPAMSSATSYWVWGSTGAYYGMPLLNLFGWYVTGIALMAALAALRADTWLRSVPRGWLIIFYALNLLLPLGMSLATGMWGVGALTFASLGLCAILVRWRGRHNRQPALEIVR